MTSIKDVARDVEMSTATVSRALRGLAGVSGETRARVMESAQRLGYVPSPSAAGLASGQTRTVAVVVPRVTQWFFAAVVQGAEEVLRESGYDLLLYNLAGDASARHRVFETSLLTKRVDAVLVLSLKPSPDERERLSRLGRPVTIVGADMPGWATVRIDDREAAATATSHLVDLGHERIGYIGGATEGVLDFTAPSARLTGYRCVLEKAGVESDPCLEADGGFTIAGGQEAALSLLQRPDRPSAVFAASDEMAIGALRAARELGLRVPEDVSVVGIDDHEMARYFDLTTVAQPVHEQGRVAATQVLAALADDDWTPEQVILPTELVVRRTTARRARSAGR
ncbi:LacI family DNA-binding transcriptional regulator [Nocardioides sp. YIM 152315]|uniref:LacI family DNA-binding transcriptional regulator n=1 Tax=Nocardioides sp. YIM 152315 TaxID=3031760 RepID=UPI0023DACAAF|nr:LacI family DNA-binding transcriptional regulator [Nocardioides sp. YIM 152315]MDF1604811.1 LacI family DNA-binding transcriptional regulator [Nocardioides sp. YIM 152315]